MTIFVSAEVNKAQGIKVLKDGKVVPVEKDEPIGNIRRQIKKCSASPRNKQYYLRHVISMIRAYINWPTNLIYLDLLGIHKLMIIFLSVTSVLYISSEVEGNCTCIY